MVLQKLFGRKVEEPVRIDVESYLTSLFTEEGELVEEGVTYVKPIELSSDGSGLEAVEKELRRNNIVVLNVSKVMNNRAVLKEVLRRLKETCFRLKGDLARISEEKILVVPTNMRIAHKEG